MHLKHQVSFAKQKLLVTMCGWLACLLGGDPVAVAQQYPGIKCIIDGNQQCRTEHTVEFNWDKESKGKKCFGKIFFSSQDAADQFQTHVVSKLELGQQPDYLLLLRANHQLALTGQVKQQLCPITEKSIDSEHQLLIAGVKMPRAFQSEVSLQSKQVLLLLTNRPTTLSVKLNRRGCQRSVKFPATAH